MGVLTVRIVDRREKKLGDIELASTDTVSDLKEQVVKVSRVSRHRQRLTLPTDSPEQKPTVLSDDSVKMADLFGRSGGTGPCVVVVKDLGPQFSYKGTFILEYALPLIVYALVYRFRPYMYWWATSDISEGFPSSTQRLAFWYWTFHYLKRISETLFVHKFSRATMPVANTVRNCTYYGVMGLFVSYFVNHPLYTNPNLFPHQTVVCLSGAMAMQLLNLIAHLELSSLRKGADGGYKVPRGAMFRVVACPNYTAEILGWVLFSVATQAVPAAVFTLLGGVTMGSWAMQKYKRLRREFGKDYPKRSILFPFVF